MVLYLITPDGQYAGRIEGTVGEILSQVPPDYNSTTLPPPRETDYWNGSDWIAIGPAPAYFMRFDYSKKKWVDVRKLEDVQKAKWEAIKTERNLYEFGGFEFKGHKFDSDYISQGRILAAVKFGQPTSWTTANNEDVELNAEDLQGLGEALANHINEAHNRSRNARKAIMEATTNDEVDAVLF